MTAAHTQSCRFCGRAAVHVAFHAGAAAWCCSLSDRKEVAVAVPRHPFRLGACPDCDVIHLIDAPPLEALRPPGEAHVFRDPERHLDDLAATMLAEFSTRDGLVLGLSYKDAPLVDRLRAAGMTKTRILDRLEDWGFTDPRAGVETMQEHFTAEFAQRMRARHGAVSLLIVRHLLEHAHHPRSFLEACRTLVAPDGWVLFETPGCESELARGDAGALWEEHLMYFTSQSLRRGLQRFGFEARLVGNYPYAMEDCLAVFGRFQGIRDQPAAFHLAHPPNAGRSLIDEFAEAVNQARETWKSAATRLAARGQRLAILGAGHRTCTLVELLQLQDLVACVIDDDPRKQGRWLPGSGIPVVASHGLTEHRIGGCVGLVNSDVLSRVAARESAYGQAGGQWWTLPEFLAQSLERST